MSFLTGAFKAAGDFLEAVDESAGERLNTQQQGGTSAGHGATAQQASAALPQLPVGLQTLASDAVMRERDALRREVSSLQRRLTGAGADLHAEQERSAALKRQVEAAYKDMAQLKQTSAELEEDLAAVDDSAVQALRGELSALRDQVAAQQQNARQARGSAASDLAAARQETVATKEALQAALQDVQDLRFAADSREASLREEVTQLASQLVVAQAAAAAAAAPGQETGDTSQFADDTAMAVLQAELQAERRVISALKADLQRTRKQAESSGAAATEHKLKASTASSKLEALQTQLAAAEAEVQRLAAGAGAAAAAASSNADLTERVRQLSRGVIEKQDALDVLQAERTALARRVSTLEARLHTAEEAAVQSGGGTRGEGETPWESTSGGGASQLKRRGTGQGVLSNGWRGLGGAAGGGPSMARLPLINRHPRLVAAAGSLDSTLRSMGGLLAESPAARALLVGYLVVLHLWVLLSTAFHAHAVVHDGVLHPDNAPGM